MKDERSWEEGIRNHDVDEFPCCKGFGFSFLCVNQCCGNVSGNQRDVWNVYSMTF